VGLFYVLSGAVLVYSGATEEGGLAASRHSLWRARFARIYPAYLLALLISAPFVVSAVLNSRALMSAVRGEMADDGGDALGPEVQ
jgi:peptidoglycan/LPS O-acetylase OafA/YrhL